MFSLYLTVNRVETRISKKQRILFFFNCLKNILVTLREMRNLCRAVTFLKIEMFDNFRWGFSCTRYCCYTIVIHGIKVRNTQFIINSLYLLKSVHGYLKTGDTVPLLCRIVVIYMYSLNRCECKITISASQINPEFRVGDESWAAMAGLRKIMSWIQESELHTS